VPEPLVEYRVKARNTSSTSENKIHDDETARRYGFPGALVPGVIVYGYLTSPLVTALGPGWLERGTVTVRFTRPLLEGEEFHVSGAIMTRDASGSTASLRGATAATPECCTATATLPAGLPTPINLAAYRAVPLPVERPPVSREALESLDALGTPEVTYDESVAGAFIDRLDDPHPLYRGPSGHVHPAYYLDQGNRAFDRNVRLGPWIHVSSTVRHLGPARVGARLQTRGRVRSLYERKGREFAELDLAILANGRPVAHVLHTAIYKLPPPRE
jgi:acyl dehydratase